jgi:hypothetical protein
VFGTLLPKGLPHFCNKFSSDAKLFVGMALVRATSTETHAWVAKLLPGKVIRK